MTAALFAAVAQEPSGWFTFLQYCLLGISFGSLIALIALGYTMVYGIIGLINFAHGDLFMLGCFLAWDLSLRMGLAESGPTASTFGIGLLLLVVPAFCGFLNLAVDRLVYKPLRSAPKLAPLLSAIGVSFIFMNVGLLWGGPADISFPSLLPDHDLIDDPTLQFTYEDLLVIVVTLPAMILLALLVKYTKLGKAMRATSQNPVAAQLMGVNVDRVIGATFLIGGALAGVASVIYCLYIQTIGYKIGFQNGLYAFTAAVLGGIGNIPGAVVGGLVIGLVRSLGSGYIGETWTSALIFAILIVILVFRPAGLLGATAREKV